MSGISGDECQAFDLLEGFGLRDGLLRGIRSDGPERANKDQQRALSAILDVRDTVGQMRSGTGRTATFLIGALQRIDYGTRECQVLVLVPTRELAQQICRAAGRLGAHLGLRSHACFGRNDWRTGVDSLRDGQHLVAGTSSTIMGMMSKGHLRVAHVSCLVLDTADEMPFRGFVDDVYTVFGKLPAEVQVCLFAASLPHEILVLMAKIMRDPVRIGVDVPCEFVLPATLPQEIHGVMESLLLYPVRPLHPEHR